MRGAVAAGVAVAVLSVLPIGPAGVLRVGRGPGPQAAPAAVVFPEGVLRGAPAPAQRQAAGRFVRLARDGLRRWASPGTALAAGFTPPPGQLGVVHMVRADWLVAPGATPDPRRPSALVFLQTSRGLRLVGGMWMMAAPGVPGPDFGGRLTPWHAHVDCRGPAGVVVRPNGGPCPAGATRETSAEMLHVWLPGIRDPFDTEMAPSALLCTIRAAT